VGQHVLVHSTAPNRMLPHFRGPYVVATVTADSNFVTATHYLDTTTVHGPFHVSRLLHFDATRVSAADVAEFQLEPGSFVVDGVIEHRQVADGSYEFHIRWRGNPMTSWEASRDLKQVVVVKDYCRGVGLPAPGTEPRRAGAAGLESGSGRAGRARGRGRGASSAAEGSGSAAGAHGAGTGGVRGVGRGRGRGRA